MLAAGSVIASKYRLDEMFARGGMGSVWRARHLLLDTDVAIKLMDPSIAASPPERARFAAEAKAAAKLKSRHIVQVHDYGLEGDTPYIVMELLEGEDLGARLKREGRLSPRTTGELLGQLARGLRRAHEMGVVHRDLKPANVFLARADDEEVAKILDFGIARFAARGAATDMTRTGTLLGSPPYMSPEQVRGLRELDYRTDLWSVGVILFRSVTGYVPFQSDQIGDLIYKICAEETPSACAFAPDLPAGLDGFFARALTKNPAGRFQSIGELVDAFSVASGAGARGPLSSLAEGSPELEWSGSPGQQASMKSTVPLQGSALNKTLPIGDVGLATLPVAQPNPRRVAATELGQPSARALIPESAARLPDAGAGLPESLARLPGTAPGPVEGPGYTMPFADPGTLSTGGRTVRSGPVTRARGGAWWKIGLLGVAGVVVAAVLIKEVSCSGSRTEDAGPPPLAVVPSSATPSSAGNPVPGGPATAAPIVADPAVTGAVESPSAEPSGSATVDGHLDPQIFGPRVVTPEVWQGGAEVRLGEAAG